MSLPKEVGKTIEGLGKTLAIAESITGGLASSMITDVPGSSRYFLLGVVAYSNESKVKLLGVKESTLAEHGAVSRQVALQMAQGVRGIAKSSIGASCTGIAGPSGGTATKPVGLVHFAVVDEGRAASHHEVFSGDRWEIKRQAAERLLELILRLQSDRAGHPPGT
jgi:nicotinamide-nucleotide amidase